MSEVSPEAPVASKFDPEAFAMNLAKAMESGGQALAAYLKPRENGDARDKPPNEIGEVVKTFSAVAEYWLSDNERSADLQAKIAKALVKIHTMNLSSKDATAELAKAVPELLAANKCPDFVEDKGHYFGTDLPDSDKRALIEYLKTF